jgi:hypothetical protein
MATEQIEIPNPFRQAKDSFKELHRSLGIASRTCDIVDAALDRNLVPREVIDRCTRDGLIKLCGAALKEPADNGLPYAKPVGRGPDARWQQLVLLNLEDAIQVLRAEFEGIAADIREFRKLHEYFKDRFGDAIPEFNF